MLDVAIEIDRRELAIAAAFTVGDGERVALFGPSGSGKSTILEVVAGLLLPRHGSVALRGRELTRVDNRVAVRVPPWTRRVGLLRQDPALFPHLTVAANIAYSKGAAAAGDAALNRIAERLEIVHLLAEHPRRLSGGQAHRVALARLLLAGHHALLLDEPYTGLDARLRRVLTEAVHDEVRERSVPSVLVAHELADAQAFADRLAVLDGGRLLQIAAPADVVRHPATRRVAELVGYLSFVPAAMTAGGAPDGVGSGSRGAVMGVHPERARQGAVPGEGVVLCGTVGGARPAGAGFEVDLVLDGSSPGSSVICRSDDAPPARGEPFEVTVSDPPWFDASGDLVAGRAGGSGG